jgi:transmembrane sensor
MTDQPSDLTGLDDPEHWEALARFITGESSAEEAESVRRWLAADSARQELLNSLSRTIGRAAFVPPADLNVELALDRVKKRRAEPQIHILRQPERSRRGWSTNLLRIAAALLLFIGGALVWRVFQGPSGAGQIYATAIGQADSLSLPDGTRVILAPVSQLVVNTDYGKRDRVVELRGEAFFDVPHDNARPFSVRAGTATVRDLGTSFSVRSETNEGVRVVVTSGSVLLRASNATEGLVLQAGQTAAVDASGAPAQAGRASDADLAWTRGQLVFENAPIERVLTDIRRWYGVEVRIDPVFANKHITATFERENAQQVLEILALTLGAQAERRGDTAFIRQAARR